MERWNGDRATGQRTLDRAFGKHTVVVSGIEMSKSCSQQHPTTPKRKRQKKRKEDKEKSQNKKHSNANDANDAQGPAQRGSPQDNNGVQFVSDYLIMILSIFLVISYLDHLLPYRGRFFFTFAVLYGFVSRLNCSRIFQGIVGNAVKYRWYGPRFFFAVFLNFWDFWDSNHSLPSISFMKFLRISPIFEKKNKQINK